MFTRKTMAAAASLFSRRRRATEFLLDWNLPRTWRNPLAVGFMAMTGVALAAKTVNDRKENSKQSAVTLQPPTFNPYFVPLFFNLSTTQCDVQVQESTSFQVMAALDAKDELKRIRMARILHDLHELAQTYGRKAKREGALGRVFKYVRKITVSTKSKEQSSEAHSSSKANKRRPASATENLVETYEFHEQIPLTPEEAHDMIRELGNGVKFEIECLLTLLETAQTVLKQDETLVNLRGRSERVIVVGDLHGSLSSLQYVLNLIGNGNGIEDDTIVIFDGDFVDRGHESLEVMGILLILKLAYPNHVFLLRGNHEDVLVSSAYGFQDEVVDKYGAESAEVWESFGDVFAALPIGAVTNTAAVVHGGLPDRDFTLDNLKEISVEERASVRTLVEPKTATAQLIQSLLWSDPSSVDGIRHNTTRTVGVFYGPDVVADFLKREGLKYLIRGHEVVEQGANLVDCGDGRSVVTVFSHSEYPNGQGSNLGAVVQLDGKDGEYELIRFSRDTKVRRLDEKCDLNSKDPYVGAVKALIASNKNKLSKAFDEVAPHGTASFSEYAEIMARILELPEVPWLVLLPSLVPETSHTSDANDETIDWRSFLALYTSSVADENCQESNIGMEIVHANHRMLMTVFKFLDFNGDGTITIDEFSKGVSLLNKRLPEDRQLKDAEKLFHMMDMDDSGSINFTEFEEVFKVM